MLLAGAGHLAWQAWLANTTYAADRSNPYVYAQTSPDLLNLVQKVEALAQVHPQGHQMLVKVMAPDGDYWPLPWYLRNLKQVGWWDQVPADPYAPVMIVSAQLRAGLDEKKTHVMVGYFQLRPQVFLELYVDVQAVAGLAGQESAQAGLTKGRFAQARRHVGSTVRTVGGCAWQARPLGSILASCTPAS